MTVPCEYSWQVSALTSGGWLVAGMLLSYWWAGRKGRG